MQVVTCHQNVSRNRDVISIMEYRIKFQDVFVFLLVIFSLNFFSAKFAAAGLLKNLSYGYMAISIISSVPFFFRKSTGFVAPVQIISISILFSIVMAYVNWGQGFIYSLSTIPYLIWFVYFLLLHIEYPINRLEGIVVVYGFLYMALFFFQFFHSDVVYFGFFEEFIEDRGVVRVNFPGAGIFFLGYFISLVKIVERDSFRMIYILFVIIGMIVTILQVTRQSIGLLMLITFFNFVRHLSLPQKALALMSFALVIIVVLASDNPISKGLMEKQKETLSEGSQYIRILAADYFLSDFSPNTSGRIFGNGMPNINSNYGKHTMLISEMFGYYLSDVGIIGMYAMFGVFPIIAYAILFYRGMVSHVPDKYYYLKYYMFFLLVTSLTSDNVYSLNFIIATVFALYVYQVVYEKEYE